MQALTMWLASLPAEELDALVRRRPDARRHRQHGTVALGFWLAQPMSVVEAVMTIDLFCLQVLEVCQVLDREGRLSRAGVLAASGDAATSAQLDTALDRLRQLALVWPGRDGGLQLADLSYVLPPRPLGLGRPLRTGLQHVPADQVRAMAERAGLGAVSTKRAALDLLEESLSDGAHVLALLDAAPPPARTLLERVDAGNGQLRDPAHGFYGGRRAQPDDAAQWLQDSALLVPGDWGLLEIPREVGVALRGGRYVRGLDPERPRLASVPAPPPAQVDAMAAGAAVRLLDAVTALADLVDAQPLTQLKDGGVGARELKRLGAALGRDTAGVTQLLTLMAGSGLLAAADQVTLDTGYDDWAARPAGERYADLVRAWRALRQPLHLDKPDGKPFPALVSIALNPPVDLPALRADLLACCDGVAPPVADLERRAAWETPLTLREIAGLIIPGVVAEAEQLGLLAGGTLSDAGRELLSGSSAGDLGVGRWFPAAVQDLLLQADLTAVVPGPPSPDLRALLDAAADRESQGGAATWRFSAASVRRALDGGLTVEHLRARLSAVARHGLPQPLDYLLGDVARAHGRVRIGAVGCYLRCADEALASEILATRSLRRLQLQQLAAGVLVCASDPDTTLALLQQAGYAPVTEDASGQAVVRRTGGHRGATGRDLADRLLGS